MAVTNAEGCYRLVLPEGLYVLEVRKEGYATSRVEGVRVASTARIDSVGKPVVNPSWFLEPPEVTVTGITQGMTISGSLSIKINARGDNHIMYIYAAFGKNTGRKLAYESPRFL